MDSNRNQEEILPDRLFKRSSTVFSALLCIFIAAKAPLGALRDAWSVGIVDLERLLNQRADSLFARMWLHLGTALVLAPVRGRAMWRTHSLRWQLLRGLLMVSCSLLAFYCLQRMPVAEFTATVMLTPLVLTALAVGLEQLSAYGLDNLSVPLVVGLLWSLVRP
jgi:drug/metabolite transporter (DMT)-like permease